MTHPKRSRVRMPNSRLAALAACCLALVAAGTAQAAQPAAARAAAGGPATGHPTTGGGGTLYKVTRPDGSVLFTDHAPAQARGEVTRMRLPRAGSPTPDPAAEQARRYWAEQDRAFQARHETRRQADAAREARLAEEARRSAAEAATDPRLPRRLARAGRPLGLYPGYPLPYPPGYPGGYPGLHRDGAFDGPGSLGHDPAGAAAGVASPYTSSPGAVNGRGGGFIGSGFSTSTRR